MSRGTVIVIIVLASVAVVLASFGLKTFFPSLVSKQSLPTPSAQPSNQKVAKSVAQLPIDPSIQAVKLAKVSYILVGRLTDRKNRANDFDIIVKIINRGDVTFTVNKNSKIFINKNNQDTLAGAGDLKRNQTLVIAATYDLKSAKWTVEKVTIYPSKQNTSPASSSAKQKLGPQ